MQPNPITNRAIPGRALATRDHDAPGRSFFSPLFPDIGARFTAPDGTVWLVGRPLFGELRTNQIFATRGGGLPGQGYSYRWFAAQDCTPFGGAAS